MEKATRLKNLRVDRVDLVDIGANLDKRTGDGAHIMLFKRADEISRRPLADLAAKRGLVDRIVGFVKAAPGVSAELIAKAETVARTFNEILAAQEAREALDELWELYYAFMEAARSIFESDEADKIGLLRAAATDFMAAFLTSMPDALTEAGDALDGIAKVGRKISAKRMAQLKSMHDNLGKLLAECEGETTMADVNKSATLTDAEIQKRIDDQVAAGVTKALADAQQKADERLAAELKKRDDEIEKARGEARTERDLRILKQFEDQISKDFGGLGLVLKAAKAEDKTDAQIFKAISEKAPEEWKRIETILKAAAEGLRQSGLFREEGAGGSGGATGSALEQINALAKELVAKGSEKTIAQAITKIASMPEHGELYARYVEESRASH